jgi:hypothetical protein
MATTFGGLTARSTERSSIRAHAMQSHPHLPLPGSVMRSEAQYAMQSAADVVHEGFGQLASG